MVKRLRVRNCYYPKRCLRRCCSIANGKFRSRTLFADKENEPAINNFNLCAEDGLAGLFTEAKSGRSITAVKDKEIR